MKLKGYKTLAILALTGTVLVTSCNSSYIKFEDNTEDSLESDNDNIFDIIIEGINNEVTNMVNDLASEAEMHIKKYIYSFMK